MMCRKVPHPSKAAARRFARRWRAKGRCYRQYECPECGAWHNTTCDLQWFEWLEGKRAAARQIQEGETC